MDPKELKKLIALMNENGLVELEVSEKGRTIVLKKAGAAPAAAAPVWAPAVAMPAPASMAADPRGASTRPAPQAEDTVTFNSPMVGTFYRASSPEAPSLVKQGDQVSPDTVLCLIEAMKVFNEIKAEMSGTIVSVLVENQEAVEFNQPLFIIKP